MLDRSVFVSKLGEFVADWRKIAVDDDVEFIDIQVNLASVLSDICERADIDPAAIGLMEKELA